MKAAKILATLMIFSAVAGTAQAKAGRYLVTFKSAQGFAAMNNYLNLESAHPQFRVQKTLKYVKAFVVKADSAEALASLKTHPEVAAVQPEKFFPAPKPINGFKQRKFRTQAFQPKWNLIPQTATEEVPVFHEGTKTPWGIVAVHAGEAWADSQAGAGARVLVLDTGVDANHPAIKDNFEKGQNFYEEESGLDPADYGDKEGHGTHVSGTIAASYNNDSGFTGVAPKAKLLMGRVCGQLGCSSIAVTDGINWGIQEHVDVISMSLGGPFGSPDEQFTVDQAEQAGVVVVAASGNDGTPSVSYPAAFESVIAVGAVDSSLLKTSFSQWGPELDVMGPGAAVVSSVPQGSGRDSNVVISYSGAQHAIKSAAFSGTKLFATPVSNSLVYAGLGKPEDFEKVNVAGKFALVSRGEIRFSEKVDNAIAAKAAGVVIFNNVPGLMQGALTEDGTEIDLPVVMIEQSEGQAIVDGLTKGASVTADISTSAADYAMFDGTSMATPHVSGVVALIKAANKKLTPAQVREILKSTSVLPQAPNDENQYGAGVVQADRAVKAALSLAQ